MTPTESFSNATNTEETEEYRNTEKYRSSNIKTEVQPNHNGHVACASVAK